MRGVLIQPPFSDPSMPVLGLAYVSDALSKAGIEHLVLDANLDFWQSRILTENIYPWPQKKDATEEDLYHNMGKVLFSSLKNLGCNFPGYVFSLNGCKIPGGWQNLNNIKKLSHDPTNPFFIWSRQSNIFESIRLFRPDWIGISVTYEDQLLPAICIAHRLKQENVDISVILGGALFTTFQDYIDEATPFWDVIDGIVIGPGGDALTGMEKFEGQWIPGRSVRFAKKWWLADYLTHHSTPEGFPDFRRFPLQHYWAPGLILPYRVLPRCSWNKCTFCADARYSKKINQTSSLIRERIEQMYLIAKRYGAQGIYFVDAELTEETMKFLINQSECHSLVWGGNARFSSFLTDPGSANNLYQAGCRLLRLGLESASPSVLDRMNKGINLNIVSEVLKTLGESNIVVHVYLMKGFPMETDNDWSKTVTFIKNHAQWIDMVSVSGFTLYEKSPVWQELLKTDKVISKTTPDCWTYPDVQGFEQIILNMAEVDGIIDVVLDRHGGSKNCLTTAHTLILSDKFSRGLYSK